MLVANANAVRENGEVFAYNLVAQIISSICGSFWSRGSPASFTPQIVGDYVKTIYARDTLPELSLEFLAVFSASLLCDYTVSEAFPVAR